MGVCLAWVVLLTYRTATNQAAAPPAISSDGEQWCWPSSRSICLCCSGAVVAAAAATTPGKLFLVLLYVVQHTQVFFCFVYSLLRPPLGLVVKISTREGYNITALKLNWVWPRFLACQMGGGHRILLRRPHLLRPQPGLAGLLIQFRVLLFISTATIYIDQSLCKFVSLLVHAKYELTN